MAYVALSRVKTLKNLAIIDLCVKKLISAVKVNQEYFNKNAPWKQQYDNQLELRKNFNAEKKQAQ